MTLRLPFSRSANRRHTGASPDAGTDPGVRRGLRSAQAGSAQAGSAQPGSAQARNGMAEGFARNPLAQRGHRTDNAARRAVDTGRTRLLVGGVLFAMAFMVIAGRLVDATVLQQGVEPRGRTIPVASAPAMARADIVDRNGVLLATNVTTASLYANPRRVLDPDDAARRLAEVLPELDAREVAARLRSDRSFVWLWRNLTPHQQAAINRLGVPGFAFQREERRLYPQGPLAAHVLGYTDVDNQGIAGIERTFDTRLRTSQEPLRLALDMRVQHILRDALSTAVTTFSAVGAAGLVLDARTGEVVAMVSLPDFDANRPAAFEDETRFNRNTLGVYEMGSTFKIFNTAMALEAGITSLSGGYDASRPLRVSRFSITDFRGKNRWLSVPEIFMYSSNIGSAKMAMDLGTEAQRAFLGQFGMLRQASVELPEIGVPMIPSPWREINTMTISYGHGIAVTPLHMANGVSAMINGGFLRPATLLMRDPDGPIPGERVLSEHTSEQMRRLLRLTVAHGTGGNADAPGYLVGGKTGSAEKSSGGGYNRRALLSSFVGAFPMQDPRFVVVAIVDEPKGTRETHGYATGGWTAAPVVGTVVARMAPLFGIEPIDEESEIIQVQMHVPLPGQGARLAAY